MVSDRSTAQHVSATRLGKDGPPSVSAISLGCMGMSAMYGAADVPADAVAGTRYDPSQMKHLDSEK
jgi:hypothetical protein